MKSTVLTHYMYSHFSMHLMAWAASAAAPAALSLEALTAAYAPAPRVCLHCQTKVLVANAELPDPMVTEVCVTLTDQQIAVKQYNVSNISNQRLHTIAAHHLMSPKDLHEAIQKYFIMFTRRMCAKQLFLLIIYFLPP